MLLSPKVNRICKSICVFELVKSFIKTIKYMKLEKFSLDELKLQYAAVCNEYVRRFCEKQGVEFDGWVGDDVGGIAGFSCQYFFTIDEIALDMNTKQPERLILDWQSDGVDYNMFNEKTEYMNYKSYTMGLRYENLKK